MSKKQSFWVFAVFLIALLTSLVSSIPAKHLLRFVELPAQVRIQGLQGTITEGMIENVSIQLAAKQDFRLTDVAFEFKPLCLVTASVCYQFRSEDKELDLNLDVNLITQDTSIDQSRIVLGSEVFKDIPQLLAQPKGELAIQIESLTLIDSKISDLVAKVDWLGAGIQGEEQILGNYKALITQEDDKLSIKLSDEKSLLSVTGDIDVKWTGKYDVNLKFESRPGLNKSVISVMEMTTKKSGLNRFSLKRSGMIAPVGLKKLQLFESNV